MRFTLNQGIDFRSTLVVEAIDAPVDAAAGSTEARVVAVVKDVRAFMAGSSCPLGLIFTETECCARAIEAACHRQRLRLHPWRAEPTRAGVTFLGYRILPDHICVRRTSVARAEARLARLAALVRSGRLPQEDLTRSLQATFAH